MKLSVPAYRRSAAPTDSFLDLSVHYLSQVVHVIPQGYSRDKYLAFIIANGFIAPGICCLFGTPDHMLHHAKGIPKSLRVETCQQVRFVRDCLRTVCYSKLGSEPSVQNKNRMTPQISVSTLKLFLHSDVAFCV